jgi:hypothetical protein
VVRQGAQHGFRYGRRLPDIDFAPWVFYIGPAYRVVDFSGWPASSGQAGLLQWTYDIPNIVGATVRTSLLLPRTRNFLRSVSGSHYVKRQITVQYRHFGEKSSQVLAVPSCNSEPPMTSARRFVC